MDRYAPKQDMYDHNRFIGMLLSDDGQWYRHDQVQATITALEQQVEALTTTRHEIIRAFIRGSDKLCLVCGAPEPCALKDDSQSPCTFEPTPMELLQANRRLTEQVAALTKERDELVDNLSLCRGNELATEVETLKAALDAERAKVKGLENAVTISEQLVESWQETATRLQDDYDKLKAQLAQRDGEVNRLNANFTLLQDVIGDLQAQLRQRDEDLKSTKDYLTTVEWMHTAAHTEFTKLRTLVGALPVVKGQIDVWEHDNGLMWTVITLPASEYALTFRDVGEARAYAALLSYCQTLDAAPGGGGGGMSIPLRCQYKKNRIVIEIGHDVLAHATHINPDFYNDELDGGQYQVIDPTAFAKEVVDYLNQEDEAGNTLVTMMLDKGITLAIENGAEGIEGVDAKGGDGE